MNSHSTFSTSSPGVLSFLMLHWKKLLIAASLSGVLALGISFFIKPKYKGTAIFYPAVTQSISNLVNTGRGTNKDFLDYGEESEAERVIQILHANEIREYIIANYDLWKHYDIDPKSPKARTKMMRKYKENVSFRRTEFNSVEISVLDTDPKRAAGMANDLVHKLDTIKNRIQQERAKQGLSVVEAKYAELENRIDQLSDSLGVIRSKGINDYQSQAEVVNKEYASAVASGNQRAISALQEKLDTLSKYGSAYLSLSSELDLLTEQKVLLERKREEIKTDAESFVPQIMPIDFAYEADSKTYPKRLLIAIGAALSGLILSGLFLLAQQYIQSAKATLAKEK
jgi:uncharacterized protein involved in exopolysaccharide biosynthesis